jgi:hypothetical protein
MQGQDTRAYNLLTRRKKEFAKLVADGVKQVDAYEQVYGVGNGTRKTRHELSSDLARRPEVQAEIARYAAELLPLGDMRAIKQEMLRTMRGLAIASADDRVRLLAAEKLHDICEKREDQERKLITSGPVSVDTLLEELQQLRGRKQAPATLEMEVVEDGESEPESSE